MLFVLECVARVTCLRECCASMCLRGLYACMGGVLDWVEWAVFLRRWRASVNGVSVEALT